MSEHQKQKRGFAVMSPERQREIARRGGQAAHRKKTAHEFTPEEARAAGQRGGRVVSTNRQHMAAIGRKGGQLSARRPHATATSARPEQWDNLPQQHEHAALGMTHEGEAQHDRALPQLEAEQPQPESGQTEPSSSSQSEKPAQ